MVGMKINAFFANRLQAPLKNPVQSWGATDCRGKKIFLRVGSWSVEEYDDGSKWIRIYDPTWRASSGHKERMLHLEAIKQGAEGYAVVVEFNDTGKIRSFDDRDLLRIGSIVEEDGLIYAEVVGKVSVDEVLGGFVQPGNDAPQFRAANAAIETTKQRLVDARIGQGLFRIEVLRMWKYSCSVTGVTTAQVIRASHIKPWINSDDAERLDPFNGLPLVATLDCLFDRGLISFNDDGSMCVSTELNRRDVKTLRLARLNLLRKPSKGSLPYLRYHREQNFRP